MVRIPEGKGAYWWYIYDVPADKVIKTINALKLEHIVFKGVNGNMPYPSQGKHQAELKDLIARIRIECPAIRGVFIFGYSYIPSVTAAKSEARAAITWTQYYDADGFVLDAEGEWRTKNQPLNGECAKAYINIAKPGLAAIGKSFGLSSYRFPKTMQPDFPWSEFKGDVLDFNYPQVYYLQANNGEAQMDRSKAEYAALGIKAPFIPVGCAFKYGTWKPTPMQLASFAEHAYLKPHPGTSIWDVRSLLLHLDQQHFDAYAGARNWFTPPKDDGYELDKNAIMARLERLSEQVQELATELQDTISELHDYVEGGK